MNFLLAMVLSFKVLGDDATPALHTLAINATPERAAQAMTAPEYDLFERHFYGLGKNKQGWPSTGFWEDAADKTFSVAEGGTCFVGTNKIGPRQRYYGGPIEPTPGKKAVTIPISPVSYGHTAGDFPGLFLLVTRNGAYLVQPNDLITSPTFRPAGGNQGSRLKASLNFLFKLVPSVEQAGNENVLPTDDEIFTAAKIGLAPLLDPNARARDNLGRFT